MVNVVFYVFVFIFGLTVGSFLNCVIYRLEKGESALKGRSYCPKCRHKLAWYDLIPLLSFFILKAKCRYCHKKISIQYPLVEIATGLLFLPIFYYWSLGFCLATPDLAEPEILDLMFLFAIASILIIIFVYDLKHYIIPDKVIFPAIGIAFIYKLFENWSLGFDWSLSASWRIGIWSFISAAFIAAGFFLAIVLITHGKGMGVGDIKLAFLMGLLLGWPNIFVAMFFAFLIGAIIGIELILIKKKTLKSEIPFGPFLVTGTFIALFWGQQITNWYLNLFI